MKTPLLAFAALALLSFPASAQSSDDAFGAALRGVQAAPPPGVKAKPQRPAPAAAKPLVAPDAVWAKVLATVKKSGKFNPSPLGLMPDTFSIKDVTGDPKGANTTVEIQVVGVINDDDKFEAMGAALTTRTTTVDAKTGNLVTEWWGVQTDIYGEVAQAGHGTVVTTADGKPVSQTPEEVAATDPRVKTQFDAMLKHWAERP